MFKQGSATLTLITLLSAGIAMPASAEMAEIQSWIPPPYWAPPSHTGEARPEHGRVAAGRQALAGSPTALPFIALPPCRLVDTRGNGAPLQGGFLPAATERSYTLSGVCGVPANAQAISLNATAVKPTGPGFLVLYPQGGTFPPVSTLNFLGNDVIVNAAVVPLSATGGITVALGVSGGDVLLDTNGYYAVSDVASLSGLVGDVTLAAGSNITITPSGNTLTIASTGGGGGGAPSGPAGGSLAGTYPNPTLATGSVGSSQILAAAVGTPQIADGNVTDAKIISVAYGKLTGAPSSLPPSGTAGGGLTGTYPNPTLAAGSVGAGQIQANAVGSTQIADGNVTDAKIVSVAYGKLTGSPASLPPSGTAGGSLAGTYPNPTLGASSVGSGQIQANTVVRDVNGLKDSVTIAGTGGVTVSAVGSTITIGSPTPSGSFLTFGHPGDATLIGAGYTEVSPYSSDFWTKTSLVNAPSARSRHSAIWTGTEMIVWGGTNGNGTGYVNTGARYNPATDSWTAISTIGAPAGRGWHTAIWDPVEGVMIVWGGYDGTAARRNDGGRYNPSSDTWQPVASSGLGGRSWHSAVWTGSAMIVFGGENGTVSALGDGAAYNPATDSWTSLSTATGIPPALRFAHSAVWTGSKMLVFGGANGNFSSAGSYYGDGFAYDAGTNHWTTVASAGAPTARVYHSATWTGSQMIVLGGYPGFSQDVAFYAPSSDTWSALVNDGSAPSGRDVQSAFWTGARMVVFGGWSGSVALASGGVLDPSTGWNSTSLNPSPRFYHSAVWTGTRMIVWGGTNTIASTPNFQSGASWQPLSLYQKN